MCFSANASFTASALLLLASIATIAKVKTPRYYLFACIPLLFSIQQAIEGFLWLSFSNPNLSWLQTPMMYGFLFFAFILWPVWIPLSVWLIEKDSQRSRTIAMLGCLIIGCIISAYLLYLLIFHGANVGVENGHIVYDIPTSLYQLVPSALLYAVATILPFFLSQRFLMQLFGILLLCSYIAAWLMYNYAFVSVWCFFTAVLSIVVYASLK